MAKSLISKLDKYANNKNYRAAIKAANRKAIIRALDSPLPENAEREIDNAIVRVGLDRLVVVQDMLAAGLTHPLPNWISVLRLDSWKRSRQGSGRMVMHPGSQFERQMPSVRQVGIPIYATEAGFEIDERTLAMSVRNGMPFDVSMVEDSTREVNEIIEIAAIEGGVTEDGYATPGLLDAPNAATFDIDTPWDDPDIDPAKIVDDMIGICKLLRRNNRPGPYIAWINNDWNTALDRDYNPNTANGITIRQRLESHKPDGKTPIQFSVPDKLPNTKIVLAQKTTDVMRVIVGQEPTEMRWFDPSGRVLTVSIVACIVPQFRDDYEGKSGIAIGSSE